MFFSQDIRSKPRWLWTSFWIAPLSTDKFQFSRNSHRKNYKKKPASPEWYMALGMYHHRRPERSETNRDAFFLFELLPLSVWPQRSPSCGISQGTGTMPENVWTNAHHSVVKNFPFPACPGIYGFVDANSISLFCVWMLPDSNYNKVGLFIIKLYKFALKNKRFF